MTHPTFVSVIIPAYNAEGWLDESLGSVIAQTFEDWEAIVVNDGSTDNTLQVANRYTSTDPRIRVISQQNGGLSVARNTGIDNARGRYLFFLDADDRLPSDALKGLAEGVRKADFPEYVKGAHLVQMPDGQIVGSRFTPPRQQLANQSLTGEVFLEKIILPHPMAWGSMISREMLVANNIRFVRNAYPREDLVFNLNLLDVKFRGVFVDTVAYIYRYAVAGSLSNSVKYKLVRNYPEIYSLLMPYCKRGFSGTLGKLISAEESSTRQHLLTAPMRLSGNRRKEYMNLLERFVPEIPGEGSWHSPTDILAKLYNGCRPIYRGLSSLLHLIIPKRKRINA